MFAMHRMLRLLSRLVTVTVESNGIVWRSLIWHDVGSVMLRLKVPVPRIDRPMRGIAIVAGSSACSGTVPWTNSTGVVPIGSVAQGRSDAVSFPVGVGALAAAVITAFRPGPTTLVAVQATGAPCLPHSLDVGRVSTLPGVPQTIMSGISCGTPSPTAWPLVSRGVDWTVTIEDDQARDAMRVLAGEGIVSGETGAAALGGLIEVVASTGDGPGLSAESSVLVLSTEGATDPVAYAEILAAGP